MTLLEDHGYNRDRCRDTINFLKLALARCEISAIDPIKEYLDRAETMLEEESFRATKFYDSSTRTIRSAINAYERYLAEFPDGAHSDEAKERLSELKEMEGQK